MTQCNALVSDRICPIEIGTDIRKIKIPQSVVLVLSEYVVYLTELVSQSSSTAY